MKLNEIILLIFLVTSLSKETLEQQQIPISINLNLNRDNIYLRLENNQILIGNRKQLNYNYQNGSTETRLVYEFLSLPFAEPPVGDKRFKNAIRLNKTLTNDVYNATYARSACLQIKDPFFSFTNFTYSEDCLYFNIWVPVTNDQDELLYLNQSKLYSNNLNNLKYINNSFIFSKSNKIDKKTTMFWIHGGAYVTGSSNEDAYDGSILASTENVIVAGTNYRLGVLGFLFLNDSRVADNIALNDQLTAIEWYKEKYVDFFGGLYNNLCLFGESAGAMSIRMLMFSKKNYLFNRVILESFYNVSYRSPQEVYTRSINYLKNTNCLPSNFDMKTQKLTNSTFDCLMKSSGQSLIEKQAGLLWFPTSDFVNENQTLNMDILFGFNQNENTMFVYIAYAGSYINPYEQDLANVNSDSTKYNNNFVVSRMTEYFKELPRSYLTCVNNFYTFTNNSVFLNDYYNDTVDYNLDSTTNLQLNSRRKAWDKFIKISSDIGFNCPAFYFKNQTKTNGKMYQYKLNKRPSFSQYPRWFGVAHTDEIPFVFGIPFTLSYFYPIDPLDRFLSSNLMNYWANFAKSGIL